MTRPARAPRMLLGLTGLAIDGGVAAVSRCVVRALDEEVHDGRVERVDRVLLHDAPSAAPPPPARGDQVLACGSQPRFIWDLWRAARRHRPDLIFFDLVGLARSVVLPVPFPPHRLVVFVHGVELRSAGRGDRARALRRTWRILANSEQTAGILREQTPELADRIRVVPLCVDPDRISIWETQEGATGPARQPVAVIVGRISSRERYKGHDVLLESWPGVLERVPGAELWIVGEGDDRARLEARAAGLGVAGAVRFLGRVPDDELGRLYRQATLLAMPSRAEGFGLVYAEAMWHGIPCIGSTADAARHVIADGATGRLVPYGDVGALRDALVALLGDRGSAAALGAAARRRAVDHFLFPRFRSDLLEALELT